MNAADTTRGLVSTSRVLSAMSPRTRVANAGLGALFGVTLGIGSLTLVVLALAIDLCCRGQNALRQPASPVKMAAK